MRSILIASALALPAGGHEWLQSPSDPGVWYLNHAGRQLGTYYADRGEYRPLDQATGSFGPPCDPPALLPRARNYGVQRSLISDQERITVQGREVSQAEAWQLLGRPAEADVPPAGERFRLSVISPTRAEEITRQLEGQLSPQAKAKTTVQAWKPDEWQIATRDFFTRADPVIYFQAPGGAVLHRQDHFEGGAQAAVDGCKDACPKYDPAKDKDHTKAPAVPGLPAGAPVALLIAGLVAGGSLLLRKGK